MCRFDDVMSAYSGTMLIFFSCLNISEAPFTTCTFLFEHWRGFFLSPGEGRVVVFLFFVVVFFKKWKI